MGSGIRKDKFAVDRAGEKANNPEQGHESRQQLLGHDVIEEIPESRGYKSIEESEGHEQRAENQYDNLIDWDSLSQKAQAGIEPKAHFFSESEPDQ
jgi:hypothetical protein